MCCSTDRKLLAWLWLLSASVFFTACAGTGTPSASVATGSSTSPTLKVSTGIPTRADLAKTDIIAAMWATFNTPARSVHMVVIDTSTQQARSETVIAHISPDRYLKRIKNGPAMIIISTTMYLFASGVWSKTVVSADEATANISALNTTDSHQISALEHTMQKATRIGPDSLGGVATLKYQYEIQGKDGSLTLNKVWLGVADHMMHRREYTNDAKKLKGTITFQYAGVKIEAPIP